jgi:hypothetical protein
MISRAPGRCWLDAFEPWCAKVQFVDKDIDDPDGIFLTDIIVKPLREKQAL